MELILHIIIFIVILSSILIGCNKNINVRYVCFVALFLYLFLVINFWIKKKNIEAFTNNIIWDAGNIANLNTRSVGGSGSRSLPINLDNYNSEDISLKISLNSTCNISLTTTIDDLVTGQSKTINLRFSGDVCTNDRRHEFLITSSELGEKMPNFVINFINSSAQSLYSIDYSIESSFRTTVQSNQSSSSGGQSSSSGGQSIEEEDDLDDIDPDTLEINDLTNINIDQSSEQVTATLTFENLDLNTMSQEDQNQLKENIRSKLLARGIQVSINDIILQSGSVIAVFPIDESQNSLFNQLVESNNFTVDFGGVNVAPSVNIIETPVLEYIENSNNRVLQESASSVETEASASANNTNSSNDISNINDESNDISDNLLRLNSKELINYFYKILSQNMKSNELKNIVKFIKELLRRKFPEEIIPSEIDEYLFDDTKQKTPSIPSISQHHLKGVSNIFSPKIIISNDDDNSNDNSNNIHSTNSSEYKKMPKNKFSNLNSRDKSMIQKHIVDYKNHDKDPCLGNMKCNSNQLNEQIKNNLMEKKYNPGFTFAPPETWKYNRKQPPRCIPGSDCLDHPVGVFDQGSPANALDYTGVGSILPKFGYQEEYNKQFYEDNRYNIFYKNKYDKK